MSNTVTPAENWPITLAENCGRPWRDELLRFRVGWKAGQQHDWRLAIADAGFHAGSTVAISPDGARIAYSTAREVGRSPLTVRSLGAYETRDVSGMQGSSNPFFSPDGRWIGFYADATVSADSIVGLTPVASHPELPIRIYAVPDPVERLYLVGDYELRDGQVAALRRVLEDDFALGEKVVLETEPGIELDPKASGSILSRADRPNRVTTRVSASGPMLAVLSDRWYPGWKVTVDGVEVPMLRANGVFRAVPVPAGVSDVVFSFAPGSILLGAAISVAGLLALAATWVMARSRTV